MKDLKAQKIIEKLITNIEKKGIDSASIITELKKLRTMAQQSKDPLVIRATRMIAEHLDENDGFELTILEDSESQAENLVYAFQLLNQSDNKYNREEIREFADALVDA